MSLKWNEFDKKLITCALTRTQFDTNFTWFLSSFYIVIFHYVSMMRNEFDIKKTPSKTGNVPDL
ncbi:MAG: hypothetical protein GF311_19960 [Candidatus Lokiarchaeota archaeon]|nr:hypothetical protein [Candidatus Lokiarchaeota archaeon]